MNPEQLHILWMILVMAAVTLGIRAFPFVLFGGGKQPPQLVLYLGRVLSPAAIAMLVVYCFRETAVFHAPYGIPEAAAALCVVGLHLWKRNPLLSIVAGTAVYMVLIQCVFA